MANKTKENPLGIRSLKSAMKQSLGETVSKSVSHDWIFSGWEKILIFLCFAWSVWSLGSFLWSLL
jgi:hypothetical protein